MITTESKGLREKLLRWNEIEKLDESSTILVNSNRLYWQLSELMRKEGRQNEVRILTKNIKKIKDERSMYVPMKVEDVISCFGMCSNELPRNTFRASGIKSGKERRNYKNYKKKNKFYRQGNRRDFPRQGSEHGQSRKMVSAD